MMNNKSPTFILVPGHWHTKVHMKPLEDQLIQRHHRRAKTVQLASVGLKSSRPTFQDDVDAIYSACSAEMEAGTDVCLVLHSYAGMPGAEAINRLIAPDQLERKDRAGTLVRAVFIAAYTFPAGFVLEARDHVGPHNPGFSIDEEGFTHMANTETKFFNDLSPKDAQPWTSALDQTYYLGKGPVLSSDNWRHAPILALLCKRDNAVAPETQEMVWQGFESEWIDAGHTPYVSQPEKVADILARVAAA